MPTVERSIDVDADSSEADAAAEAAVGALLECDPQECKRFAETRG